MKNSFSHFNVNDLPYNDIKLLYIYIEWMSLYDMEEQHANLTANIISFFKELRKVLDDDKFNLPIITKVYNPVLGRERWVVEVDGVEKIMDELTRTEYRTPMLYEAYPDEFFHAIGEKQWLRAKKLKEILK